MGWKFALLGIVIGGIGVTALFASLSGMNWNAPSQGTNAGATAFWGGAVAFFVGLALVVYGLFN